jgi:hypothetical protein
MAKEALRWASFWSCDIDLSTPLNKFERWTVSALMKYQRARTLVRGLDASGIREPTELLAADLFYTADGATERNPTRRLVFSSYSMSAIWKSLPSARFQPNWNHSALVTPFFGTFAAGKSMNLQSSGPSSGALNSAHRP